MGRSPPSRSGLSKRKGTFCIGLCNSYKFKKQRGESIYKYAVLCSNCLMYIPRKAIIKKLGYKKYACPCCNKNWLKGLYWEHRGIKHKKPRISPDGPTVYQP